MGITKEKLFVLAADAVATKKKHQDYAHVNELTDLYYRPLITGKGTDHLLKRFNMREDDELFKQRKLITQLTTSSVCNTILSPVKKVGGVRPLVKVATYGAGNEEKNAAIIKEINNFYGEKSVDYYLSMVAEDLSSVDPNSWILINFNDFDSRYEKPDVYPTEITCRDAYDFAYHNNELQYLFYHRDIEFEKVGSGAKLKKEKGHYFVMLADNDAIEFSQIDTKTISNFKELEKHTLVNTATLEITDVLQSQATAKYYMKASDTELYVVTFYEMKSKGVPAIRNGYILDKTTEGRTCVSIIQPALPYLLKSVKSVSEMDLTASLHAFPQKFVYYPRCQGEPKIGCNGGSTPDGATCTKCKGLGYTIHTTAQDHIGMKMPERADEMFDLSKLGHYLQLPVETIQWMDEYVDKLESKCLKAVYNSEIFSKTTISTTATEKLVEKESVYDSLKPLAMWRSTAWEFIVKKQAIYKGMDDGLTVRHVFDNNLKFETVEELISRLKSARDAGSSEAVILQIDNDLTEAMYGANIQALKEVQVKRRFNPFDGKTENVTMSIIAQNLCTQRQKILYTLSKEIFTEAESKSGDTSFYDLAPAKQKAIIDSIVNQFIIEIEKEETAKQPTFTAFDEV